MPTVTRRRFAASIGITALAATGGCTVLPTLGGQTTLYGLSSTSRVDGDAPQVGWQLAIESFSSPASLDTVNIATQRSAGTIDYFSGVAWTDRAPAMIQRLLVESFQDSGRIVGVGREVHAMRADYQLRCELRDFQAEVLDDDRVPTGVVRIGCALVRLPERRIVSQATHGDRRQASAMGFDAAVRAIDQALGQTMAEIVGWTLRTGQQDWQARDGRRSS